MELDYGKRYPKNKSEFHYKIEIMQCDLKLYTMTTAGTAVNMLMDMPCIGIAVTMSMRLECDNRFLV
jgi:hypothetical protein